MEQKPSRVVTCLTQTQIQRNGSSKIKQIEQDTSRVVTRVTQLRPSKAHSCLCATRFTASTNARRVTALMTHAQGVGLMGAGDVLMAFLGSVIISFGFRIYAQRDTMARHAPEILGASFLSSLFSFFTTAFAAKALGLSVGGWAGRQAGGWVGGRRPVRHTASLLPTQLCRRVGCKPKPLGGFDTTQRPPGAQRCLCTPCRGKVQGTRRGAGDVIAAAATVTLFVCADVTLAGSYQELCVCQGTKHQRVTGGSVESSPARAQTTQTNAC